MTNDKIEDTFHTAIWGVANDWMKCQRAIAEGRDLCYEILKRMPDDDGALHWMANVWLDNHGRDPRREVEA